jgi:hypothetical protein
MSQADKLNPDHIPYTPDPDAHEAGMPRRGQRVKVNGSHAGMEARGLEDGHEGIVVGHARGRRAHRHFVKNVVAASKAGRPVSGDDYEPLIDNEGPLVQWDGKENEDPDWFPGQAEGIIAVTKPFDIEAVAEIVRQALAEHAGAEVGMFEPVGDKEWLIGAKTANGVPLSVVVGVTPDK